MATNKNTPVGVKQGADGQTRLTGPLGSKSTVLKTPKAPKANINHVQILGRHQANAAKAATTEESLQQLEEQLEKLSADYDAKIAPFMLGPDEYEITLKSIPELAKLGRKFDKADRDYNLHQTEEFRILMKEAFDNMNMAADNHPGMAHINARWDKHMELNKEYWKKRNKLKEEIDNLKKQIA